MHEPIMPPDLERYIRSTPEPQQGDGLAFRLILDYVNETVTPTRPDTFERPWILTGTELAVHRGREAELKADHLARNTTALVGGVRAKLHQTKSRLVNRDGVLVRVPTED